MALVDLGYIGGYVAVDVCMLVIWGYGGKVWGGAWEWKGCPGGWWVVGRSGDVVTGGNLSFLCRAVSMVAKEVGGEVRLTA